MSPSVPGPPCYPPSLVLNQDSTHRTVLVKVCRTGLADSAVDCSIVEKRLHTDFRRLATFMKLFGDAVVSCKRAAQGGRVTCRKSAVTVAVQKVARGKSRTSTTLFLSDHHGESACFMDWNAI